MAAMQRICVFCGSSSGFRPDFAEAARAVGTALARRGLELVYGGGKVGLMGVMADAALAAGGRVTGVIPEALVAKEVGHAGLTELRIVRSMHERKALMADLADGFVALPGGMGTLDELFEILTWAQLGIHAKPCGLLNVAGYFEALLQFVQHSVAEGFVRREHGAMLHVAAAPDALLDLLEHAHVPVLAKWVEAPKA